MDFRNTKIHIIDKTWKDGVRFLCGNTGHEVNKKMEKPYCKICMRKLNKEGDLGMKTLYQLETPRGKLNIKAEFSSAREAEEQEWRIYFSLDRNTDIYSKAYSEYSSYMAVVKKTKE